MTSHDKGCSILTCQLKQSNISVREKTIINAKKDVDMSRNIWYSIEVDTKIEPFKTKQCEVLWVSF